MAAGPESQELPGCGALRESNIRSMPDCQKVELCPQALLAMPTVASRDGTFPADSEIVAESGRARDQSDLLAASISRAVRHDPKSPAGKQAVRDRVRSPRQVQMGIVLGAADEPDARDTGKLMKASRQAGGELILPISTRDIAPIGLHADERHSDRFQRPPRAIANDRKGVGVLQRNVKAMDQNGRSNMATRPSGKCSAMTQQRERRIDPAREQRHRFHGRAVVAVVDLLIRGDGDVRVVERPPSTPSRLKLLQIDQQAATDAIMNAKIEPRSHRWKQQRNDSGVGQWRAVRQHVTVELEPQLPRDGSIRPIGPE